MSKALRKRTLILRILHSFKYILPFFLVVFLWKFLPYLIGPSAWDGNRRFTIAIQTLEQKDKENPVAIFSIEPQQKKAVYFILSPNTLLNVPFGYKIYPARSVYSLGSLDKTHAAGLILSKAVESTLGIYVDGYAVFERGITDLPESQEALVQLKKNKYSFISLIQSLFTKDKIKVDTNISLADQRKLFFAIQSLRADQLRYVDLASSFITSEDKWPDGSQVWDIDPDRFEVLVAGAFQDSRIRTENMAIEVVNGAGIEKLGSGMSHIFEHLGANVISITTAKQNQKNSCTLILSDKLFSDKETVRIFSQLFKCGKDYKIDPGLSGDVKIILGEDFVK